MTVRVNQGGVITPQSATPEELQSHNMGTFSNYASSPAVIYTSTVQYDQAWEHPISLNTAAEYLARLDPGSIRNLIDILETNARSLEDHLDIAYLKTSGGQVYGNTTFGGDVSIFGTVSYQNVPLPTFLVSTGTIMMYGSSAWPIEGVPGYLLCDNDDYLISQYPNLYAVVQDTYGTAPTGYFKLPDLTSERAPNSNPVAAGWYMIKT